MVPIIAYFEGTWIGKLGCNNCCHPSRFPHILWNVHHAVVEGLPKMNNAYEGWHCSFMELPDGHCLTILKFFKLLQLEQSRNENDNRVVHSQSATTIKKEGMT